MRFPSEYEEKDNKETTVAKKYLGFCGRMVGGSKSGYGRFYPCNVPIFNSNLCTKDKKIWYGDVDITLDEQLLLKIASELNQTLYLFYEMDARFENENSFKLERAVLIINPDSIVVGERLNEYIQRATRGRYAKKLVYKPKYRR